MKNLVEFLLLWYINNLTSLCEYIFEKRKENQMVRYDCTLEGIRARAESRRLKEKEIAKYESIHKIPIKNPVENRNGIPSENGTGIEFTLLQEIIAAILFYACIYLYWFVN